MRNSPGVNIGNDTDRTTSERRKCLVFHVTSTSGLLAMALAKMGASLVGSSAYAFRTCASVGFFVTCGGINKNERHALSSAGNFDVILRSASSITCGEINGRTSPEKQTARMTPAAPVGELSPARIALVSRNTLGLFCIGATPYSISCRSRCAHQFLFRVCRSGTLRLRQRLVCFNFHLLHLTLQSDYFFVHCCLSHANIVA